VRRLIMVGLALGAAMALPVSSGIAGDGNGQAKNAAAKLCKAEKKADKAAFKATYGPKHAMRTCKKGEKPEVKAELKNAAQECRDERSADPDGFKETYGGNTPGGENSQGGGKNAFGKCVSTKVRAEIQEEVAEFKNAAQECRDERAADPDGFKDTYGSNAPGGENAQGAKKNAFGKCVKTKVHAAEEGE
jgi:hypothetical protein